MNYELAKKLKDAGFAQTGDGRYILHCGPNDFDPDVYRPTLSELIEACGFEFDKLQILERYYASKQILWSASSVDFKNKSGSTPEEAVANLYLALKGV
jgi:hypothetical protein